MSERHKTHNGRDLDGHFKVRQADVDELLEDPAGVDFVRDDVRLGGAVADVGPRAGESGERIERLISENEENVQKAAGRTPRNRTKPRGRGGNSGRRGNKGGDGMR